jgi:hypothetical protein
MEDVPMKRTKAIETTVGDLIVSLTDETLKYFPEPQRAYGIVASMLAGLPLRQSPAASAGPARERRAGFSAANVIALCFCLIAAFGMNACTSSFEPRMSAGVLAAPRMPTAKGVHAGVEVSIEEYLSSYKSRRAFDADLGAHGVLPLLVHIENKSSLDYRIERSAIRAALDGQPLANIPGLEAAATGALRNPAWNALVNTAAIGPLAMYFGVLTIAGSASQTQKINRQIEQHFERMELENRVLKPNESATGFAFFRIPNAAISDNLTVDITLEPEVLGDTAGQPLVYHFTVNPRP